MASCRSWSRPCPRVRSTTGSPRTNRRPRARARATQQVHRRARWPRRRRTETSGKRKGSKMSAPTPHAAGHDAHAHHPTGWKRFVYSTNHKDIGTMYLVFAVVAGLIGGAISVLMRLELMHPGMQFIATAAGQFWNVLITAHGLILVCFLFM